MITLVERDPVNLSYWKSLIMSCWKPDEMEPSLVDALCRSRGWNPLARDGKMVITECDGRQYEIRRLK